MYKLREYDNGCILTTRLTATIQLTAYALDRFISFYWGGGGVRECLVKRESLIELLRALTDQYYHSLSVQLIQQ